MPHRHRLSTRGGKSVTACGKPSPLVAAIVATVIGTHGNGFTIEDEQQTFEGRVNQVAWGLLRVVFDAQPTPAKRRARVPEREWNVGQPIIRVEQLRWMGFSRHHAPLPVNASRAERLSSAAEAAQKPPNSEKP